NTVRLRFEENAQGSFKTMVEEKNVPEWTPIEKGKEVKIEATPISGYKFVKAMLDGKDITGNTFKINQYGVLAAVFDVDNGIHNAQAEAVKVVRHNGNIVVMGLQAEKNYNIYDASGKLLSTGLTDANGEATVSLPAGYIIIIRQDNLAIKVMQ
ncbi:MAG: leucine-rich repeat domain-containing protein, partial [Prevotella intermedia]